MGKDTSTPPATDYNAAANANHVNQYTPYGNQIYTPAGASTPGTAATPGHWVGGAGGGTDRGGSTIGGGGQTWVPGTPAVAGTPGTQASSTITLDPRVQQTLDTQLKLSNQMGDLAIGQAGEVANQGPFDLSGVQQVADKAYGALQSRLDPQWEQNSNQEYQRLANQGVSPGSEAYNSDMRVFNQGKNDAYQQANLAAIQTMPQTYQLASEAYNQPLNRLNALRSGAQIQTPQFGDMNSGAMQAAQLQQQQQLAGYNANVASNNAMTSGLFGLGSTGLMAAMMMSDRRLKTDISEVGETKGGLPVYTYRYKGDQRMHMGVMAQDVEKVSPEAVGEIGGFKAVDYSKVQ